MLLQGKARQRISDGFQRQLGIVDIPDGVFHGTQAGAGPVENGVYFRVADAVDAAALQDPDGGAAHDGGVYRPDAQQDIEKRGGFAHHLVRRGKAGPAAPVQKVQKGRDAPFGAGIQIAAAAEYAGAATPRKPPAG